MSGSEDEERSDAGRVREHECQRLIKDSTDCVSTCVLQGAPSFLNLTATSMLQGHTKDNQFDKLI